MTNDTQPAGGNSASVAARRRRAVGVATEFDPARLCLARRLARMRRSHLADRLQLTAAAVSQYEKGQARPTLPILAAMALALGVPVEFLRAGHPTEPLSATAAHFRSLRSTTALERDAALAVGELAAAVFAAVERHLDLPAVHLPEHPVDADLPPDETGEIARQTRAFLGLGGGPVPHVVRLLEAHGVGVLQLPPTSRRVDAFSTTQPHRPLVLLNPEKADKGRSRFDAAHELGHLVMHRDVEPGSRLVETQAHAFAAEFLMPADEILPDLPARADWARLHAAKRRWGVSLTALVLRANRLGVMSDYSYRVALRQLAAWGYPEPGPLGPPEAPSLLPRAVDLLHEHGVDLDALAAQAGLPLELVQQVINLGAGHRPALQAL